MPKRTDRRPSLAASLTLLFLLGTGAASMAGSSVSPAPLAGTGRYASAEKEREKVLVTLESRMTDEKALEKMRDKLDVLAGRKLRLAAALCDRIARVRDSAGADLAFSLVTALIVLG